jgi:hypothetical protein
MVAIATSSVTRHGANRDDRSWSSGKRAAWWAKFLVAVAAGIMTLAGAGRLMGFRWDIQTGAQARADRQAIEEKMTAADAALSQRLHDAELRAASLDVKVSDLHEWVREMRVHLIGPLPRAKP